MKIYLKSRVFLTQMILPSDFLEWPKHFLLIFEFQYFPISEFQRIGFEFDQLFVMNYSYDFLTLIHPIPLINSTVMLNITPYNFKLSSRTSLLLYPSFKHLNKSQI